MNQKQQITIRIPQEFNKVLEETSGKMSVNKQTLILLILKHFINNKEQLKSKLLGE